MNEEEKEAIEYLKRNDIVEIEYNNYGTEHIHRIGIAEKQILLNYISKLQKDNEELKEENFDQVYMKAIVDYKEKIREKIKELVGETQYLGKDREETKQHYAIRILKELLGE